MKVPPLYWVIDDSVAHYLVEEILLGPALLSLILTTSLAIIRVVLTATANKSLLLSSWSLPLCSCKLQLDQPSATFLPVQASCSLWFVCTRCCTFFSTSLFKCSSTVNTFSVDMYRLFRYRKGSKAASCI